MPARAALLLALVATSVTATAADPKAKDKGKPNRLAKESSPYLLQHAHNPVDWFPWGEEAFAKAKKEGKLIFLSIGYSSCHWCHVMERESFSHPDVAKILNELYVCIKVDREERPDVDDVYMTALNVAGESGGWPLSMFLTPEGKPIFGGTYWPREDREVDGEKAIGFKSVLGRVSDLHKKEKDGLYKQADRYAEMTAEAMERTGRVVPIGPLTRDMVSAAAKAYEFDTDHGGLKSSRTKFPRAAVWMFLLQQSRKPGNDAVAKQVKLTLDRMALGGIYDQLGGGFHRYSTEKTWTVPHFEKMLYDNAQLVELYAEAYRATPDPLYKRAVAESLAFVAREMTAPEGGFYSALDADSEGEEGRFYVWTPEELAKAVPAADDREFLKAVYATGTTNFEGKYHIFRLPKPAAEIAKELKVSEADLLARLEKLKARLFEVRAKRERPFLDTKVIAGWNGQMIAGYAKAGEVFKDKTYTDAAAKAANFLLAKLRTKDGRLLRLYAAPPGGAPAARGNAFLDDYAFVVHGLLNLHDATGDKRWLAEAKALTDALIKWHGDADRGGFYSTSSDHEKLFARGKDSYDGAQPSGNGVAARNLLRVWQKTGDVRYRDWCRKTVKLFSLALRTNPTSVPGVARTLDELLDAEAADPAGAGAKDPDPVAAPRNPKASADVVKATLKAGPVADGSQPFTITLATAAPWHLYANPVGNKEFEASVTMVEVYMGGKRVEAKVTYPAGTAAKDKVAGEYRVYEGTATITGTVPRPADGELEVWVKLMACKEGTCLLPSTLKLTAK